MGRHPIAVVAARTGLSVDVLRVWERRYGAVQPTRSAEGQRLYSDADVERLRWLRQATEAGRSIGQVATLPSAELAALVAEDAAARAAQPAPAAAAAADEVVDEALARVRVLDGPGLEAVLRRAVALSGVSLFLDRTVVSLLQRIGDEWHSGALNAAQEHLASSVVQQVVLSVMRTLIPGHDAPRVVVATPSGERHAIGAALAAATAAADGWRVIYLGADLPASDIATSAVATDVQVVALSMVYVDDRARLFDELRALRAALPAGIEVVAGGAAAVELADELRALGVNVRARIADHGVSSPRRSGSSDRAARRRSR